jgi:hypothetical protein
MWTSIVLITRHPPTILRTVEEGRTASGETESPKKQNIPITNSMLENAVILHFSPRPKKIGRRGDTWRKRNIIDRKDHLQ